MVNPIVDAVVGPALGFATAIIDRLFPDKEADSERRSQLLLQAQQIDSQLAQAQLAVDQAEASNPSLFVAGWRPWVGWCCGMAFAYNYLIQPFLAFAISNYSGHPAIIPALDMQTLSFTLCGMLGIGGGLRTIEKIKGVA